MALPSQLKLSRPLPRVLVIAINNPPYNLLNGDVFTELRSVLASLAPKDTGAVIITSALDGLFCSHYDVAEILQFGELLPAGAPVPPWAVRGLLRAETVSSYLGLRPLTRKTSLAGLAHLNLYHEVTALIRSIPQVVIAAMNGRSFGGGCEMALACDFRIMVDTPPEGPHGDGTGGSGIGQPEILLGLIPGGGGKLCLNDTRAPLRGVCLSNFLALLSFSLPISPGTQMLTRMLGPAKALEICLEGRPFSVQEAYDLGLITKVVPVDRLMPEALQLAQRMARRSPAAIAAVKQSVHEGASKTISQGMLHEQGLFASSSVVPEAAIGMRKYLDNIDSLLGPQGKVGNLNPLVNGTFTDFTPGAARQKAVQKSKQS